MLYKNEFEVTLKDTNKKREKRGMHPIKSLILICAIFLCIFFTLFFGCVVFVFFEMKENYTLEDREMFHVLLKDKEDKIPVTMTLIHQISRIDSSFYPNFTLSKLFQAQKCLDLDDKKKVEHCNSVNYTIVDTISTTISSRYYIGKRSVLKQFADLYRSDTCKNNKSINNILHFSFEKMCYEKTITLYDQYVWR